MIARLWHGRTRHEDADAYEELLRTEVLPGIRRREGYEGAWLLRRVDDEVGEETEFVTLTLFRSVEAARSFSADGERGAVVPDAARRLLSHFDERSSHFEVVLPPEHFG